MQPSEAFESDRVSLPTKKIPGPVQPLLIPQANVPAAIYNFPLVWFAGVWIIGTLLSGSLHDPSWRWPILIGAALIVLVGLAVRSIAWLSSLVILTGVGLLAAGYALAVAPTGIDSLREIATRQPQPVALRGVIATAATWSPSQFAPNESEGSDGRWITQWFVRWTEIRDTSHWRPIESQSNLMVPGKLRNFLPGDRVEVMGSLRRIEPATNPGVTDFSRIAAKKGIYVSVKADEVSQIQYRGATADYVLSRFRGQAVRWVDKIFEQKIAFGQAPLAAALIFGQRQQVDWEQQQQMMATGTIHMLAISGMHVEMIAGALLIVCLIFSASPRLMLCLIVSVCALYAGLAGGQPPVMRAVILITAVSIARYWGLQTRLLNLLSLAALILLVIDPSNIYSPGVHLSFLAVSTIGVFYHNPTPSTTRRSSLQSLLEESLSRWRRGVLTWRRNIWAAIRISFWVGLMTSPIIWSNFNLLSPISVPMNVVLAIPLTIGLVSGLMTAIAGWIPLVGWMLGSISGASLGLISWLVDRSSQIPWGHLWLPSPPAWWVAVFYLTVVIWLMLYRRNHRQILASLLVVWIAVGILLFLDGPRGLVGRSLINQSPKIDWLQCTFLDVGHGCCVLIELPDGRLWMYDAGRLGDNARSYRHIAPSVWDIQAARIDTLIISHADSDHYNAVLELLKRFAVTRVASTHSFWTSQAGGALAIREELDRKRIPRQEWHADHEVPTGEEVSGQVLHPAHGFSGESDNAASLCLQLEYAGVRMLLTGDIEGSGMETLCSSDPLVHHIITAPHHGSLSHDPSELLEWSRPEVVVISGGERAIRPEVAATYSTASKLGITFRDGAIRTRINADGTYSVLHWQNQSWHPLEQSRN